MTDSSQALNIGPRWVRTCQTLSPFFRTFSAKNVLPQILIRLAVVEPAQFDRLMSIRVLAAIKEQLMTDQADDNKVTPFLDFPDFSPLRFKARVGKHGRRADASASRIEYECARYHELSRRAVEPRLVN